MLLSRLIRPALKALKPARVLFATTVVLAAQSQYSQMAECSSFSDKQMEGLLDKINKGID